MSQLPDAYFKTHVIPGAARDPLPPRFAIITAFNPWGKKQSPRLNRQADLRLKRLLERSLGAPFRTTNCDPYGGHREPAWAAVLALADAVKIGRRFKQLAILWVENEDLHLVDCDAPEPRRLGSFRARLIRRD